MSASHNHGLVGNAVGMAPGVGRLLMGQLSRFIRYGANGSVEHAHKHAHTHTYTHTHTHVHTCLHPRPRTCVDTNTHMCTHVHIRVDTNTHTHNIHRGSFTMYYNC